MSYKLQGHLAGPSATKPSLSCRRIIERHLGNSRDALGCEKPQYPLHYLVLVILK